MPTTSPSMRRSLLVLAGIAAFAIPSASRGDEPATTQTLPARFRQPVAACLSRDGGHLYVANRRTGSLSVVAARTPHTVAEFDVGRGLADVAVVPGRAQILAVDQADDALLVIGLEGSKPRVVQRLDVSHDPVSLTVDRAGKSCVVASRWSRMLTIVEKTQDGPDWRVARTLGLPFSPRELALVRDDIALIAADAHGGRLAVVDPRRGVLERVRSLPAHNIRGLALTTDGASLAVSHQVLLGNAHTTYEDIHWGLFLNNELRVLDVDRLLSDVGDRALIRDSREIDLGDPGRGSGDPSAVTFDRHGHVVVALAGVDEVLIGTDPGVLPYRPEVGRRPVDVVIAADGRSAYVVNSLDDTVSVVDLERGRRVEDISLGPPPAPTAAERGERMFSDARRSHDGWMSCHSCHTDGHTSGGNSDTLGDGGFGAPKRIPSLLGVAETGPWGWTGRFERLEDQVRQSIVSTMQGETPPEADVTDIVAYLRTLSPTARTNPTPTAPGASRGRVVFERECATCHAPPLYSASGRYDVGLVDEKGNRKFNPPSLRGVGRNAPLLHDGRAATLVDVFKTHRHPNGAELTDGEIADLVAFLRTL